MKTTVRIDIVSDVMCPWCVIGYASLRKALEVLNDKVAADIHWQPFELNPDMALEGENLREHLMNKYQISAADSDGNRARITEMGAGLDFDFRFTDDSRIVNTFNAHQLLHWASEHGLQTELKWALFTAHFTNHIDVSSVDELVKIAASVGLDAQEAQQVLIEQRYASLVRDAQQRWQEMGIHSVPAMVFNNKYLVSGGQPVESYIEILARLINEAPAH